MRVRRILIGLVFAASAVGVVGPSTAPAQAQCDPEPVAIGDGTFSGCSNTCQSLGAAVERFTKKHLWDCTM